MADDTDTQPDKDVASKHFASSPSPGEMLRKARAAKKLDTKEIAATMNVDPWMLDALEHDEYGALGAPVFAKGHLRKYATALGLDEGDVMVSYYQRDGTREAPPLVAESILRVESTQGTRLNWLAPAAGVVALALIALVLFLYFQPNDSAESARAATVSTPAVTTVDEAGERSLTLPPSRSDESGAVTTRVASLAPARTEPAPEPQALPEPATPEPEPEPVVAAPVATPTVAAPASEPDVARPAQRSRSATQSESLGTLSTKLTSPDEVRVTLSFAGESWVEVYDANRAKLLYDMGQSGTRRSVSGPGPLQVFLGKAVDVEVNVNGRPYPVPRVSRLGTARFYVDARTR